MVPGGRGIRLAVVNCTLAALVSWAAFAFGNSEHPTPTLTPTPTPPVWPLQFHARLVQNRNSQIAQVDLWYDYKNGRNLNLISPQLAPSIDMLTDRTLSPALYDVEYTNGTSFYFTLLRGHGSCAPQTFPVGILRPNWLANASYMGQEVVNNITTNVWAKADFVTYYEDTESTLPVKWVFFDNAEFTVLSWDDGAVLDDDWWQAPSYCFTNTSVKVGRSNSRLLGYPID